jgi:hypothetical protein
MCGAVAGVMEALNVSAYVDSIEKTLEQIKKRLGMI